MVSQNESTLRNCDKCDSANPVVHSQWSPRAGDIMQCGVVSVGEDQSVYAAIGLLVEKHLSGLPVVNDGELVGIISEKDVLRVLYETENLTGNVADYMTRKVVGFDMCDTLEEVGLSLVNNSFRRVAIHREGKLSGIISRSDLIRHYVSAVRAASIHKECETSENVLQAKDVMQCGLLTVARETSLLEAADILSSKRVTGLPVVDKGMHLEGIVSEKDILRTMFYPNESGAQVTDIMTDKVVSFSHTDSLFDICNCLINSDFRRVPILNNGRLVGIVSRADIVMFILKNRSTISRGMVRC